MCLGVWGCDPVCEGAVRLGWKRGVLGEVGRKKGPPPGKFSDGPLDDKRLPEWGRAAGKRLRGTENGTEWNGKWGRWKGKKGLDASDPGGATDGLTKKRIILPLSSNGRAGERVHRRFLIELCQFPCNAVSPTKKRVPKVLERFLNHCRPSVSAWQSCGAARAV